MRAIFRGEADLGFVDRIPVFGVVSGILVVASIVVTVIMGLNFGIDFAGGYEIQVKFPEAVSDGRIKEIIAPVVGDARVQRFGDEEQNEFLILVRKHGTMTDALKSKLKTDFVGLAGGDDKLLAWSIAESGESMKVGFDLPIAQERVQELIEANGLRVKEILSSEREDKPVYQVALFSLADQIEVALRDALAVPAGIDIKQRVEFVGPQVGAQLRNQGILAVVWALLFIMLYIAVRFDLFFAPGAVIALIHDVSITVGIFAVTQMEFNLPIIAAILTIVGYSLNDTIVVYDRIRENVVRLRGRDFRKMVNTSLNQTLSRTLLTSLTTLLVVLALIIFGGGIIRTFSIALLIGVVVGTYSSLGIATPAYILLRERFGKQGTAVGGEAKAVS